ncbi:hypothetical protein K504DRAFT_445330 [Pleomassaria siparia CBS 279.74]|uniref:RRM domain-containing protein n=1 Tax=Pleomassaria siparia CBS 279.74 TaxID=1314801 RepID=A0A6G1KN92_9PLEO|nr:hypothetical protein K504DRAFT_445330 [Pleomassaria siparia CBS 279.74]
MDNDNPQPRRASTRIALKAHVQASQASPRPSRANPKPGESTDPLSPVIEKAELVNNNGFPTHKHSTRSHRDKPANQVAERVRHPGKREPGVSANLPTADAVADSGEVIAQFDGQIKVPGEALRSSLSINDSRCGRTRARMGLDGQEVVPAARYKAPYAGIQSPEAAKRSALSTATKRTKAGPDKRTELLILPPSALEYKLRVLFIKNLEHSATDQQVRSGLFAGCKVVDFLRSTNANTGKAFNKGFALLPSIEVAKEAQKKIDGKEFMGRRVEIMFCEIKKVPRMTAVGFTRDKRFETTKHEWKGNVIVSNISEPSSEPCSEPDLLKADDKTICLKNLNTEAPDSRVCAEFLLGYKVVDFIRAFILNEQVSSEAYVLMETSNEALRARDNLQGCMFWGNTVDVQLVAPSRGPKVTTLGFQRGERTRFNKKDMGNSTPGSTNPTSLFPPVCPVKPHRPPVPETIPDPFRNPVTIAVFEEMYPNSADKKITAMTKWLNDLPQHPLQFYEPTLAPRIDSVLYQEWLAWAEHAARRLLYYLDKCDWQHRAIGLKYHSLPYPLRHSSTHATGAPINRVLLSRLSQIFETNRPTSQDPLFIPWFRILAAVNHIVSQTQLALSIRNVHTLRSIHQLVDHSLSCASEDLLEIAGHISTVSDMVGQLREQRKQAMDGPLLELLKDEFSCEGNAMRRWIWTFNEVQARPGQGMVDRVEELAVRFIEIGAWKGNWWRGQVPLFILKQYDERRIWAYSYNVITRRDTKAITWHVSPFSLPEDYLGTEFVKVVADLLCNDVAEFRTNEATFHTRFIYTRVNKQRQYSFPPIPHPHHHQPTTRDTRSETSMTNIPASSPTLYETCGAEFPAIRARALVLIADVDEEEQRYFKAGLAYHRTCRDTRADSGIEQACRQRLSQAFAISTPAQREQILAPLRDVVGIAHAILRCSILTQDEEVLAKRHAFVTDTIYHAEALMIVERAKLTDLYNSVEVLQAIDMEGRSDKPRIWWEHFLYGNTHEWVPLDDFVFTAPGPQRLLEAGKDPTQIVVDLLCEEPGMFYDPDSNSSDVHPKCD